jgi:hypothetical protein
MTVFFVFFGISLLDVFASRSSGPDALLMGIGLAFLFADRQRARPRPRERKPT